MECKMSIHHITRFTYNRMRVCDKYYWKIVDKKASGLNKLNPFKSKTGLYTSKTDELVIKEDIPPSIIIKHTDEGETQIYYRSRLDFVLSDGAHYTRFYDSDEELESIVLKIETSGSFI